MALCMDGKSCTSGVEVTTFGWHTALVGFVLITYGFLGLACIGMFSTAFLKNSKQSLELQVAMGKQL
eukprot:5010717-Ditylum_brightwellii.AAC.1